MEPKTKVAPWLTLEEVQDFLGVRAQTIYAYVSRGLIASHPDPHNIRRSLYSAENIQAETEEAARPETGNARRKYPFWHRTQYSDSYLDVCPWSSVLPGKRCDQLC